MRDCIYVLQGMASRTFCWDEDTQSFVVVHAMEAGGEAARIRLPGTSVSSLHSLLQDVACIGTQLRRVQLVCANVAEEQARAAAASSVAAEGAPPRLEPERVDNAVGLVRLSFVRAVQHCLQTFGARALALAQLLPAKRAQPSASQASAAGAQSNSDATASTATQVFTDLEGYERTQRSLQSSGLQSSNVAHFALGAVPAATVSAVALPPAPNSSSASAAASTVTSVPANSAEQQKPDEASDSSSLTLLQLIAHTHWWRASIEYLATLCIQRSPAPDSRRYALPRVSVLLAPLLPPPS